MRNFLLKTGVYAAVVYAVFAPAAARADGPALTLKIEPGVAAPLTSPQTDRFGLGGDLTVKPLLSLTPWLAVGPSLSVLALSSDVAGVDTGTAYRLGAGAEIRRSHANADSGLKAASPWLSAEIQYVRTGDLNRVAPSLAAGVAVPTSAARTLWVGPFVKYLDVVQSMQDRRGFDNSDAKVLIAGVSFEIGAAAKKKAVEPTPPPPALVPPVEKPKEKPKAEPQPLIVTETFHGIVQFPLDSSRPLPESTPILQEALKLLTDHADLSVTLEGHASSEGTETYNQGLSERRAQAVKEFLVQHGVREGRLTVKGFGEGSPVADNNTDAGRRLNRRVEYTVSITFVKEGAK